MESHFKHQARVWGLAAIRHLRRGNDRLAYACAKEAARNARIFLDALQAERILFKGK